MQKDKEEDADYEFITHVDFIDNIKALEISNIKPVSEAKTLMKKCKIS